MDILKKAVCLLLGMLLLIHMTGCKAGSSQDSLSTPKTISEYSLSHGITSLDILKESLKYEGAPIQIEYEFENGNKDSNIGLLLFLDGHIQPFTIDKNGTPKVMNIIELKADSKKSITIAFDPVRGQLGETIPLHIVAIFDAGNTIQTPTIAISFFQALSQAFPVRVEFQKDSSCILDKNFYNSQFTLEVKSGSISKLDIQTTDTEAETESKLVLQGFLSGNDQESKHMKIGESYTLELSNVSDENAQYHVFCFIDNKPVLWKDSPFYSITVPSKSEAVIGIKEIKENNNDFSDSEKKQLFFIAVPIHDASKQLGTMVLKTKTVNLK